MVKLFVYVIGERRITLLYWNPIADRYMHENLFIRALNSALYKN
jgi:hypothetical protein